TLLLSSHSLFSLSLSLSLFFFFNPPPTTEIYPLSLHDALPISARVAGGAVRPGARHPGRQAAARSRARGAGAVRARRPPRNRVRSEEHTSELQSPYDLVCRLLLEKKKKKKKKK